MTEITGGGRGVTVEEMGEYCAAVILVLEDLQ